VWCVREDGRLQSVLYDDVWEPGQELPAACPHGHSPPDADCACGLYAVRKPEGARRYLLGRDEPHVVGRVLGQVALWGTVVEAELGWRASRAYPAALEPAALEIARLYGVPACPAIPRWRSFERRSASSIG
jgi:hypothetical protein